MFDYDGVYKQAFDNFVKTLDATEARNNFESRMYLPYLPIMGRLYGKTTQRILFLGQDYGEWDCPYGELSNNNYDHFLKTYYARNCHQLDPLSTSPDSLLNWQNRNYYFWEFPLRFMCLQKGLEYHRALLNKAPYIDAISSFAWGNCNSLVIPDFTKNILKKEKTNYEFSAKKYRELFKAANNQIDKLENHIKLLNPNIIIILTKRIPANFTANIEFNENKKLIFNGLISKAVASGILIYFSNHPSYIKRQFNGKRCDYDLDAFVRAIHNDVNFSQLNH